MVVPLAFASVAAFLLLSSGYPPVYVAAGWGLSAGWQLVQLFGSGGAQATGVVVNNTVNTGASMGSVLLVLLLLAAFMAVAGYLVLRARFAWRPSYTAVPAVGHHHHQRSIPVQNKVHLSPLPPHVTRQDIVDYVTQHWGAICLHETVRAYSFGAVQFGDAASARDFLKKGTHMICGQKVYAKQYMAYGPDSDGNKGYKQLPPKKQASIW